MNGTHIQKTNQIWMRGLGQGGDSFGFDWSNLVLPGLLTSSNLDSRGLTWTHFVSCELAWSQWEFLRFARTCLISRGLAWIHLVLLDCIWFYMGSLGLTWLYWFSFGSTWFSLGSLGSTASISLRLTWSPSCSLGFTQVSHSQTNGWVWHKSGFQPGRHELNWWDCPLPATLLISNLGLRWEV